MTNACTILLLEDEPIIALDIEESLLQAGFGHLTVLRTCSAALEYLLESRPDAAIVDVNLEDGICSTVVDRLNEAGIPFLVHSGFEYSPAEHSDGFRRGQWLSKPTNPDVIVVALQEMLQRVEPVASVVA